MSLTEIIEKNTFYEILESLKNPHDWTYRYESGCNDSNYSVLMVIFVVLFQTQALKQ